MENPLASLHSLNDLLHPDVPLCLSRIFCQKDAGSLIIYLKLKNIHRTFLINIMYIIFMHTRGNFVNLNNKLVELELNIAINVLTASGTNFQQLVSQSYGTILEILLICCWLVLF